MNLVNRQSSRQNALSTARRLQEEEGGRLQEQHLST